MKNRALKVITFIVMGILGLSLFAPAPVSFAKKNNTTNNVVGGGGGSTNVCDSTVNNQVKEAAGCFNNKDSLRTIVQTILESIIIVMGIVAVVFIVIGGINYMTSQGDPGKLKKAKDTILYAVIGLIVCALAFAIVNWTIGVLDSA